MFPVCWFCTVCPTVAYCEVQNCSWCHISYETDRLKRARWASLKASLFLSFFKNFQCSLISPIELHLDEVIPRYNRIFAPNLSFNLLFNALIYHDGVSLIFKTILTTCVDDKHYGDSIICKQVFAVLIFFVWLILQQ